MGVTIVVVNKQMVSLNVPCVFSKKLKTVLSTSVFVSLSILVLCSSSAHATAEIEPGDKLGMAPTSSVLDSRQIGPIAMMEYSTNDVFSSPEGGNGNRYGQRQSRSLVGYIQSRNRNIASDEAFGFAQAIMQFSGQYGVDYRLLTSIIAIESSFRRDAVSSSGAIGMGQLKPDTARWLGVSNPYDPVDNIAGTARFLAWLLRRYNGNLEYVVSAYYQGPGHVDKNGISPVCRPYLQKVNNALGGLL